nr:hypothetical protein [Euzebyales bacterium]
WHDGEEAEFVGDGVAELAVDGSALHNPVPLLRGVRATSQYRARLREKLYVFNAGHAVTAYLGWLRGHATVAEAIGDPFVRPIVVGGLLEARRALLSAYPTLARGTVDERTDVHAPVVTALRRYADAELADPVTRVARDPLRKLRAGDRLLGPVQLIRQVGGAVPAHFTLGIAAGLLYGRGPREDAAGDTQARELRGMLSTEGVMAVLGTVCGLDADDPVAEAVAERYRGFVFTADGVSFPPARPTGGDGAATVQPVNLRAVAG